MKCREVKKILSSFLDEELESDRARAVAAHLKTCPDCRRESETLRNVWHLLGKLEPIEPDAHYRPRFWARVDEQTSPVQRLRKALGRFFAAPRRVPLLAAATALVVLCVFGAQRYVQHREISTAVAELGGATLELVENLELAENYEVIQQLDWISDLEIIEILDHVLDSRT